MITKCLIKYSIYTKNIYGVCHSKNDLPSLYSTYYSYQWITINNYCHRDNDLPNFIIIRKNINNTYNYGYNKYNNWYKYNGYSYISYKNNKLKEIIYKFFNGICIEMLKENLN